LITWWRSIANDESLPERVASLVAYVDIDGI